MAGLVRHRTAPGAVVLVAAATLWLWTGGARGQDQHGAQSRDALDKMRDRDLQPDRVMDVSGLRQGMTAGEAGASYGYFTIKMSRRVGPTGTVYANDIDADALRTIEQRSASLKVGNIKTVLGEVTDDIGLEAGSGCIAPATATGRHLARPGLLWNCPGTSSPSRPSIGGKRGPLVRQKERECRPPTEPTCSRARSTCSC